jgi:CMP-N,N'-diacetyllegionaminic acid synthase
VRCVLIWGMVPARGGSKSIPRKNLASLQGIPLLDYGVRAASASSVFDRLIGSSEDEQIAERFRTLGIEVDRRPAALATDDAAVADVARDLLNRLDPHRKVDVLVLIQPTSPFLRIGDLQAVVSAITKDSQARSCQTVARCPHNHHAWNQREVAGRYVKFVDREERQHAYQKQMKPIRYVFGNLVAVRAAALHDGAGFFAEPSIAVPIEAPYDLDVDTPNDLTLAEALLASGQVSLRHMVG